MLALDDGSKALRGLFGKIILAFVLGLAGVAYWYQTAAGQTVIHTPLLLESGLVQTDEGEISIVVWLPDDNKVGELQGLLAESAIDWGYKKEQTSSGATAVTIAGETKVGLKEEQEMKRVYAALEDKAGAIGGRVYLEERVGEVIDGTAYMAKNGVEPLQWIKTGETWSWAGYARGGAPGVLAGKDRLNIQLLTRSGREEGQTEGQTLLAFPVLLQEF